LTHPLKIENKCIILIFFSKRHPGAKLQPQDAKTYGQMEQWLSVESESFNREAVPLVWETLWKPKMKHLGEVDQQLVDDKKKKLEAIVVILDAHLGKNQYFAGDQFTLADISYLPYTENLIRAGLGDLLLSKTNFAAWWKKCSERPSWKLCKTQQEVDF
jgi:glutathione S-transferase